MKKEKLILIFLLMLNLYVVAPSQNRMYLTFNGGMALPIEDVGISYLPGPAYGLTWTSEQRITGSLYSLIGVGLEQISSKKNPEDYFTSASSTSSVNQTSLNFPLLLRINVGNLNHTFADIGVTPGYIVICNLTETNSNNSNFDRNVAADISRFRMAIHLGVTRSFGSFNLGGQFAWQMIDGVTTDLARKWEDSVFVKNNGNTYGAVFSLTAGFRIK